MRAPRQADLQPASIVAIVAVVILMGLPSGGRAEPVVEAGPSCDADMSLIASQVAQRHRADVDASVSLPVDVDGLKALLAAMRRGDQDIRSLLIHAIGRCGLPGDGEALRPVFAAGRAIDDRNRDTLRRIVHEKGWPVISVYGQEADQSAFLVAQHADRDRAFQKDVLAMLDAHYRVGETSGENDSLLFDRVRIGDGKRQRYGSQGLCVGNDWMPDPMEDTKRVDALRKEVGLDSMAAYRRRAATLVCASPS